MPESAIIFEFSLNLNFSKFKLILVQNYCWIFPSKFPTGPCLQFFRKVFLALLAIDSLQAFLNKIMAAPPRFLFIFSSGDHKI